jgi:hypothetical protein
LPVYNVVMGQGITVANLGANMLITGPGEPGDRIQSCAAVIFFDTGTCAGGLYHFPSGNILHDGNSRNILTAMRDAVNPNEAYIVYGIAPRFRAVNPETDVVPSDEYAGELRSFVLALLPLNCRLRRMPAKLGIASISQAGNVAIIGLSDPDDLTNLRGYAAGHYNGYTLYGTDMVNAH